ncbi:AcrR family transcriptional regulator [Methylobacterium brachiatum]|uniref:AcrR family transcriptional regulator n=1 Tax=Methylobacterium brachiatum TaxID=269660 RepID=A0AAJ1TLR5_9HYPH|nr:hypothetical protein [Methylobacterium brachiatum]MCB4802663.1 hypothetical protein [Methylobacterium brachiatum]MDQ0543290.1 AcrR family transcriptional regulator [Methylobacterium brachiatum]
MTDDPKDPGGRPSHVPTDKSRREVEALSGYGIPEHEIARVVGISKPTLLKHYRDELDQGITKANAKVAESLFRKAIGDGPQAITAAIFWAKTRMRWKEPPQSHEIAGANGGPIQHVDLSKATDEQLAALEPILAALAAGDTPGTGSG